MTIATIGVDDPITAAKFNEVINAINALGISWINFNGITPVSIRAVVGNIAGVTRTSAGLYRISFTTPRANANYMVVANCTANAGNDTGFVMLVALTTTYVDIWCRNDDGGANDSAIITVAIIGG